MTERVSFALVVSALVSGFACAPPAAPDGDVLAVVNAHLYPVSGAPIENGILLVRDGQIAAIGAGLSIPRDVRVLDIGGRSVIPGLVESHSHMGFKQLNIPATGRNNCLGQDTPVAIRGATVLTGAGDTIEGGTIVFEGGKIVAVGADVAPPGGSDIIEAEGLYATPGFIDAYSHVGFGSTAGSGTAGAAERQRALWDRDRLMAASRRMMDSLQESLGNLGASKWLQSGVTTTYVSPGNQNLVGGIGAVIKLTGAVVREAAAVSASFGETALNAFEAPTTRQGMVAILRQTFIRAQEDALAGDEGRTFVQLLTGELPFRVLVNTPDDILTALRLAEEFDLTLVLDSAAGGHEVAEAIAEANVSVVVGPAIIGIGGGGSFETFAHTPANAASLHRAGARIALSTAGFGTGRSVVMEALMAKAHGLPKDAALKAATSDAAASLWSPQRCRQCKGSIAKPRRAFRCGSRFRTAGSKWMGESP